MNKYSTETRIQLLADGELPDEMRNQLLRTLDDHPQLWRKVALAFVENQVLEQTFRESGDNRRQPENIAIPDIRKSENSLSIWETFGVKLVALAACMLIGWFIGANLGSSNSVTEAPDSKIADSAVQVQPVSTRLELTDALARSYVPVPADFRKSLLAAGYFLDEKQELAEVSLPNGNLIKLPVRQFNIHYMGSSAYQ